MSTVALLCEFIGERWGIDEVRESLGGLLDRADLLLDASYVAAS